MNDSPVKAVDVTRQFVRILALAMMVGIGFNFMQSVAQLFAFPARQLPSIFLLNQLGGLVFWGFVWMLSGAIGEALAFEGRERNALSMGAFRALALPCFGFFLGADGLAKWISNVVFALVNGVTSSGLRTPFTSLWSEISEMQSGVLLFLLLTVLQIGIGFFLAFIWPRLRPARFVDEA